MDNHFHLLLRVPHRPEGLDVPLEVILARMERAVGEHAMKLVRRDMAFWETTGNVEAIEEWRQRQLKRMYSLSEFIDGWFEKNREFVKGSSRTERKRGSRSLGRRALRGLYSLRDPRN